MKRRMEDDWPAVGLLRKGACWMDVLLLLALVVGREDAATCAGALSTTLRCAAELLEGPTQR
ncbi:hypothetical protein GCM10011608_39800 [Micromonospora sonchi]|uniref:Uncharacterized protein n=1 Tax=Micromonospora sonchi TaxID=1763543 RepID=A0A917U2N4_9ACTN|nr:hypothetical protein GCM10011608_39800 [Micromonospora sonchi]